MYNENRYAGGGVLKKTKLLYDKQGVDFAFLTRKKSNIRSKVPSK